MTKQVSTDNQKHLEVIPQKDRSSFCKHTGSGRYTTDWMYALNTNYASFKHTPEEKNKLAELR